MIDKIKTLVRGIIILIIMIIASWVLAFGVQAYPWVFAGILFLGASYLVGSWTK